MNEHPVFDFDLAIIGSGPAGIQAAIHATRKQARTVVLGHICNSALFKGHIENYAFVDAVTLGSELLQQGLAQAKRFGADFLEEDLLRLDQEEKGFRLHLESGREISAHAVLLSMGAAKKKLGVPGEEEFLGKGVSYCVDCDANFFRNATVCVTGDRSAAADGALTLSRLAAKVYLVSQQLEISQELAERLQASPVERVSGKIAKILGEHPRGVQAIQLENGEQLTLDGVFIELGSKGALELATQLGVALDPETMRSIQVNRKQETNIPGVYAAGDITGPPFQMAKAVGEGCVAGMEAANHALKLRRQNVAA